ncbi:hypothetical protein DPMN_152639 [Dreissena polymorpha]|uniref:Uncharacterized protein n=1 Tax=Dreissena polymorpha TaxID=45954 RepID=A0A9D4FM74_DREPO|nr:hypothetical protein DPMN_152639 [Dreissena polymorpha]
MKQKEVRNACHRLAKDVTTLNAGLMSRLPLHKDIESTCLLNGSVLALTKRQERTKFDLYENIGTVIRIYTGQA